jgi:hypothetical protein
MPTKPKQGFWKKLGNAVMEILAQIIYQGPR